MCYSRLFVTVLVKPILFPAFIRYDIVLEPHENMMNITVDNIQSILQQSLEKPALLFIGLPSDPMMIEQQQAVEDLSKSYPQKLLLAKLDIEQQHALAQQLVNQLQISALPAYVFFHQGQPIEILTGAQSNEALHTVLAPLMLSPAEMIRQQIDALIAAGDTEQALTMLQNILQQEPDNTALQVLQVNLLLELGRIEEATQLLAHLPDDAEGIAQPKAKLAFYAMAIDAPSRDILELTLCDNQDDHEARYQLAIRLVIADEVEQALEQLLVLLRKDRSFREDGGSVIDAKKVFEQLGSADPLTKRYRGKLFGLLH